GALLTVGSETATTDSSGTAIFNDLVQGVAQLRGVANGYVSTERAVTLSCNEQNSVGLALSPTSGTGSLNASDVRIVLTWGENPSDLDSHLTGPDALSSGVYDESNRFHVYYASSYGDVAALDVDDVTSYGPETITITPPAGSSTLRPGLYRYSVYHFSGVSNISSSNAAVTVQFGGSSTRNYVPPAGASSSGDVWTVFELVVANDGSITVYDVNTITPNQSSSTVRSTATGLGEVESGVDFVRLPRK
ncbi:MAG: hypothetical protein RQ754_16530, partial [Desulfuromonadales bacterium]|nr:hypothetical protein [Desulfuromonadales bacterium]